MTIAEVDTMLSTILDTDIFTGVAQRDIEWMLAHPQVRHITLKRGQYIYHHGDVSEKFWIIISGRNRCPGPKPSSPISFDTL